MQSLLGAAGDALIGLDTLLDERAKQKTGSPVLTKGVRGCFLKSTPPPRLRDEIVLLLLLLVACLLLPLVTGDQTKEPTTLIPKCNRSWSVFLLCF